MSGSLAQRFVELWMSVKTIVTRCPSFGASLLSLKKRRTTIHTPRMQSAKKAKDDPDATPAIAPLLVKKLDAACCGSGMYCIPHVVIV